VQVGVISEQMARSDGGTQTTKSSPRFSSRVPLFFGTTLSRHSPPAHRKEVRPDEGDDEHQ
jgi:hypothetical protein